MDPAEAALAIWLDPLTPEDMPVIAAEWLATGRDGPAVTHAACCRPNDDPREVRDAFVAALDELGVSFASHEDAEIGLLKWAARTIEDDEASLLVVRRRVCRAIDFDVVTYEALPDPYLRLLTVCWLIDSDVAEEIGGMDEFRRAVWAVLDA
jgi:hypothetical protein